jgi:hypothetical protein
MTSSFRKGDRAVSPTEDCRRDRDDDRRGDRESHTQRERERERRRDRERHKRRYSSSDSSSDSSSSSESDDDSVKRRSHTEDERERKRRKRKERKERKEKKKKAKKKEKRKKSKRRHREESRKSHSATSLTLEEALAALPKAVIPTVVVEEDSRHSQAVSSLAASSPYATAAAAVKDAERVGAAGPEPQKGRATQEEVERLRAEIFGARNKRPAMKVRHRLVLVRTLKDG